MSCAFRPSRGQVCPAWPRRGDGKAMPPTPTPPHLSARRPRLCCFRRATETSEQGLSGRKQRSPGPVAPPNGGWCRLSSAAQPLRPSVTRAAVGWGWLGRTAMAAAGRRADRRVRGKQPPGPGEAMLCCPPARLPGGTTPTATSSTRRGRQDTALNVRPAPPQRIVCMY